MKKRIFWGLCGIGLAAILLISIPALFFYYHLFESQVREDLRSACTIVAQAVEATPDSAGYPAYPGGELRLTVIGPDGTVLYDSAADVASLPNHADRPEVAAAVATGRGSAVRQSSTLEQNTYYEAIKLSSGEVVRVARNSDSILSIFFQNLPLMLLVVVAVLIGCMILSHLLSRRIIRPLKKAGDDTAKLDGYDELAPFFKKISSQQRTIQTQVDTLQRERDTVRLVLRNMKEGLILLDPEKKILLVNKSAEAFLHPPGEDPTGQNLVALSREAVFLQAVDEAMAGKNTTGLLQEGARVIRYYASPVYSERLLQGAIVLLLDATEHAKAEQIRREFSANVSHELKTPLTSISGFAEILRSGMVQSPEKTCEFGGLIYKEAARLLDLIDDIMRLSRIEEGGQPAPLEQVRLSDLADEVHQALTGKALRQEVTLEVSYTRDAVVKANRVMLYELLYNLCDNAIKYNRPGGIVSLSVQVNGERAIIAVQDSGIGIAKEDLERIFERFYRVDKSRSKDTGGTGLGLSIVKHIVEYHHGEITVDSVPGEGTKVTVLL